MSENAYRQKIKNDWIEEGANAVKANMADELVTIHCPDASESMQLDIDLVKYFNEQVRDYFNCLQIGLENN